MKLLSCLLLLLVLAAGGSASAVVDVGRSCPYEEVPGTLFDVPYILLNKQYDCYKPGTVFLVQINAATTTEDFRQIFSRACQQAAEVKACIGSVAVETDVCLDPMQHKMYATVRDFVLAGVEEVCAAGSDAVARMYGEELKPLGTSKQLRVLGCISAVAVQSQYSKEQDLPAYTKRRYTAMKDAKECVGNVVRREGKTATHFEGFMDRMLSVMKCISPASGEIVLCSSLEGQNNTDTNVLDY